MKNNMILMVLKAEYLGGHSLLCEFNNGEKRKVDLSPLLSEPAYRELTDEKEFERYGVDGTVFWANGADIAPEYLLEHGTPVNQSGIEYLEYKGFTGSVEFSKEDNCYFGEVLGLSKNTMITYEGATAEALQNDFHGAVDDYLKLCRERGIKPFVGSMDKLLDGMYGKVGTPQRDAFRSEADDYFRGSNNASK